MIRSREPGRDQAFIILTARKKRNNRQLKNINFQSSKRNLNGKKKGKKGLQPPNNRCFAEQLSLKAINWTNEYNNNQE